VDVRGLSLKKKRVSPNIIMVFQWISAYHKEEGALLLALSTWSRVDSKEFASQNPKRFRPDTRDRFLITGRDRS